MIIVVIVVVNFVILIRFLNSKSDIRIISLSVAIPLLFLEDEDLL